MKKLEANSHQDKQLPKFSKNTVNGRPITVFEDTYLAFVNKIKQRGLCTINDVYDLIKMMQKFEMDCHIVIAGQNGVGKTSLLLAVMSKFHGKQWFPNLMLAKHTTNDIIQFILHKSVTLCGVDEWNQYLNYLEHGSSEQKHFMTQLELARSKSIAFVGCVRDPRKLTKNYRDGKMSVVLWTLDRYIDGGSYAAVFVTNPVIESYDRFGFDMIPGDIIDFDEIRTVFESLPSFVGYLNMDNLLNHLDKKEITHYKQEKDMAMAYAHANHVISQYNKKKITRDELMAELHKLEDLIPAGDLYRNIPIVKQSKLKDY